MIASISSLLATQAGSTAFISKQLCVQIKIFFLRSVGFRHYFGAMERFTCFQRWHFIASDKVHLHGRNSESDFLCVHSTIFVVLFPLFPYEIFSPWNAICCAIFLSVHWCKSRSRWAHHYCSAPTKLLRLHLPWGLLFFQPLQRSSPCCLLRKVWSFKTAHARRKRTFEFTEDCSISKILSFKTSCSIFSEKNHQV